MEIKEKFLEELKNLSHASFLYTEGIKKGKIETSNELERSRLLNKYESEHATIESVIVESQQLREEEILLKTLLASEDNLDLVIKERFKFLESQKKNHDSIISPELEGKIAAWSSIKRCTLTMMSEHVAAVMAKKYGA